MGSDRLALAVVGGIGMAIGFAAALVAANPLTGDAKDVIVAFAGGGFGLLTGLGVTSVGLRHSRSIEQERWTREDTRWRQQLEREDQHRFTSDRKAAYERLLSAAEAYRVAVHRWMNAEEERTAEMDTAGPALAAAHHAALLIASPAVGRAVIACTAALRDYFAFAEEARKLNRGGDDATVRADLERSQAELYRSMLVKRDGLLDAMRSELGGLSFDE